MAKTIVIVVNSKSKIDVLLRHLETVVRPGDRIVFLAAYQRGILDRLSAHVSLMQTGLETAVVCEEHKARLLWDEQKARLERDVVSPARQVFRRLGVEVDLNLYSGSLKRVMKRYEEHDEVVPTLVRASSWLRRLKIVPKNRLLVDSRLGK